MTDGIEINDEEFKKLKVKDQMNLIFKNTKEIKTKIEYYRFHQKILYSSLTIGGIILTFIASKVF